MDVIAGLPISAWLLLLVSVGLPLSLELAFFTAHRKERRERKRSEAARRRADAEGSAGR